jgi:hypothetical protein
LSGQSRLLADAREAQRSAPDLEVDPPEYSEVTRNRRSAAGNQNLRPEISGIRRASGFSSLFCSIGRFGDSIARQPNLWPEIQVSAGTISLQAAKQIPFMR